MQGTLPYPLTPSFICGGQETRALMYYFGSLEQKILTSTWSRQRNLGNKAMVTLENLNAIFPKSCSGLGWVCLEAAECRCLHLRFEDGWIEIPKCLSFGKQGPCCLMVPKSKSNFIGLSDVIIHLYPMGKVV